MDNQTKKVIQEIQKLDAQQINAVVQAIKLRRNQLHNQSANAFIKGDRVEFDSSRTGRVITGTVSKVKIKYVLIDADNGDCWNVPGSHVRKIQQEVLNA